MVLCRVAASTLPCCGIHDFRHARIGAPSISRPHKQTAPERVQRVAASGGDERGAEAAREGAHVLRQQVKGRQLDRHVRRDACGCGAGVTDPMLTRKQNFTDTKHGIGLLASTQPGVQ